MRKRITRIGPLSAGLVSMAVFGGMGLLLGIMFAIFGSMMGGMGMGGPMMVVILPLLYGVIGFVSGVVSAFIYNLAASVIGGIVLTFGDE